MVTVSSSLSSYFPHGSRDFFLLFFFWTPENPVLACFFLWVWVAGFLWAVWIILLCGQEFSVYFDFIILILLLIFVDRRIFWSVGT